MHVYPFSITKASLLVVSVLDMLWRCLHFGVSVGVCCDMWDRRPLTRPHEPIGSCELWTILACSKPLPALRE